MDVSLVEVGKGTCVCNAYRDNQTRLTDSAFRGSRETATTEEEGLLCTLGAVYGVWATYWKR
jgi:hypothetical protein